VNQEEDLNYFLIDLRNIFNISRIRLFDFYIQNITI